MAKRAWYTASLLFLLKVSHDGNNLAPSIDFLKGNCVSYPSQCAVE